MRKMHVLTLSLSVLLGLPGLVRAAYYYEAKTTVQQGGDADGAVSAVHAWVDGLNAKVEFVDGSAGPAFTTGEYLLSSDGGKTLYVVDPEKKTYSEVDLSQIFQMAGNVTDATKGVVKLQFSDFSNEKLGEEKGDKILGYATTRYRYKTGYTMTIGVLGFSRSMRTETQLDFNCANALKDQGFSVWMRPDRFRTGNESMDKLIDQQYADLSCLPLRNKSVTTTTTQNGKSTTQTTTVEVTTLRKQAAPAGAFAIPADYQKTSLMPNLSDAGGKDGSQTSQQQTEEKPKKRLRLRDLLGR